MLDASVEKHFPNIRAGVYRIYVEQRERERERERILDVARNGSDNRGRGTVPFDSILSQSFSRINPHGESNNR